MDDKMFFVANVIFGIVQNHGKKFFCKFYKGSGSTVENCGIVAGLKS